MDDFNDLNKPTDPAVSVPGHAGQRRRSFLKLGAVPATLTLVSRPAQAWHCNSTSAWGSASVNPNASVTARNSLHQVDDECWSVSNWQNNTPPGNGLGLPWAQYDSSCTTSTKFTSKCKGATLGQVFGSTYSGWPAGCNSNTVIYTTLQNNGPGTFLGCIITAMLNKKYVSSVGSCLTASNGTDQLHLLFNPPCACPGNTGKTWYASDVINYLQSNWMAT